jgi:hypothetical protein
VERIVAEFDTHFATIKDPNKRIDYLQKLAAENWDFRKGRERFEVEANQPMDEPGSELGKRIFAAAKEADMASTSPATLKHYNLVVILGGANNSPYNRLRYALTQNITYDLLAYLGSERELLPPEREITKHYAPAAKNELDLGKGAILTLMNDQLATDGVYEVYTSEWQIIRMQQKDGVPIMLLSSPPYLGGKRANTADTYDFLRRLEQEGFTPEKNILFVTGALYRYAQYFDAVREITLRTGLDVETIGFEQAFAGLDFKPSQFLQELKAAADAAVRLRNAVQGHDEKHSWRSEYYGRFTRKDRSAYPH